MCTPFNADSWLLKDQVGGFLDDFHRGLADSGRLGIAMPGEFGGEGLSISEFSLIMHRVSNTGVGSPGVATVHMNIYG